MWRFRDTPNKPAHAIAAQGRQTPEPEGRQHVATGVARGSDAYGTCEPPQGAAAGLHVQLCCTLHGSEAQPSLSCRVLGQARRSPKGCGTSAQGKEARGLERARGQSAKRCAALGLRDV